MIYQDHCPKLAVSTGGHPKKLTTANILYTKYSICTSKIKNAMQAAKSLSTLNDTTITPQTVHRALESTGMISVAK